MAARNGYKCRWCGRLLSGLRTATCNKSCENAEYRASRRAAWLEAQLLACLRRKPAVLVCTNPVYRASAHRQLAAIVDKICALRLKNRA